MTVLPAKLFGSTVEAICRNVAFCPRAVPADIYSREILYVRA